ncbi:MAG: Smr/MutS family protein [Bacilli bacterium]|nr:Smr/MutS family protein [Bacilli bacterium]
MILFRNSMPQIDLHGEDRIGARLKVEAFLSDNYKIGNLEVAIIHGLGNGILKKEVFNMLRKDDRVSEFCIDCFNGGCTLVRLSKNVDKKEKKCYNTRHNLRGNY